MRRQLYSEAKVPARKALELRPTSVFAYDRFIYVLQWTGRFQEAAEFLERRPSLNPSEPFEDARFLRDACQIVQESGIGDDAVEELQRIATELLLSEGEFCTSADFFIQEDGESKWVSIWMKLHKSVDRVVDLNLKLCDRLATIEPPITADRTVGYMYVCAERS
jgi:hypothetical protein